jgi:putative transposase
MQPLYPNTSYHIFNHGNGFENLFLQEANFHYFLEKYALYISPIAETYAYCLMPNHFHFVVHIRGHEEIERLMVGGGGGEDDNFSKVQNFGKVLTTDAAATNKYLSKQFSNLFSCYTQSFNKVYRRRGSLFIKNFKREPITDHAHLLHAIIYVHRNPVHHGFCSDYIQWEYSSYGDVFNERNGLVVANKSFEMFGGKRMWINLHQESLAKIEQYKLSKGMEI